MFKKFVAQRGVTLCIKDGRIKRMPLRRKIQKMEHLEDEYENMGGAQMTMKELKALTTDDPKKAGDFFVTSDSMVFN